MRHLVLRCVWLAAVALSATGATGCRGDEGPPQVAPGTAVGKVVDVAGQVTATRDGKTRVLAPGEAVSPDDVVATADTGSVSIELFHNRANLQLQNGAASRIDDSLAWELTKSAVEKLPGGKVMVSAGRHGEKSAAESANNVVNREQPGAATTTPPTSPPPVQPMVVGVPDPGLMDDHEQTGTQPSNDRKGGPTTANPGPKPPAKIATPPKQDPPRTQPASEPPTDATRENDSRKSQPARQGGSPGRGNDAPTSDSKDDSDRAKNGTSSTNEESRTEPQKEVAEVSLLATRVEATRAKLKACLQGDVKHLAITVTVSAGKLTFRFAETGAEAARTCVQGVLKRVDVKNADGSTSIEISL